MINKIDLTNFKSIKKGIAKLPKFGAIVGKNAVGKTNLIQSIRFLNSLAGGKTTFEAQKDISLTANEIFYLNENATEFQLSFDVETNEEKQYQLIIKANLINEAIKPAKLEISHEKLMKVLDDTHTELIYLRDKSNIVDKNNSVIPIAIDANKLLLSLYKNTDSEAVKDLFNNITITNIENFNYEDMGSIDPISDNLASILVRLHHNKPDVFNKFQVIIKKLMPHFSSVIEIPAKNTTDPTKEEYLILFEELNLKEKISMQSASAGDLRTLFYVAHAVSMNDGSTLIIEEIENGVHPKRLVDLMDHLEIISMKKNAQIIFTTHNPIVINRLSPAKVLLTEKENNTGTFFTLIENSDQITNIRKLLEHGGKLTDYINSR